MKRTSLLLTFLLLMFSVSAMADNSGRIYGIITTVDGDKFEGLIRWDKNEGSWVDILNGTKVNEDRDHKDREKKRKRYRGRNDDDDGNISISLFGLKINTGKYSFNFNFSSQSGLRFGHIKNLKTTGNDNVHLILKSGQEIDLVGGSSTDMGTGIREIIIEDKDEGEIEFVWNDIDNIEFMSASSDEPSTLGERLYGTLYTRRGDTFTGAVCWDYDEIYGNDVLDGDTKGRRKKIKFKNISQIERYSSNGATVTLKSGKEMLLKGTNDVDNSNNGIIISDLGFGQVIVDWKEFDRIEFHDPVKIASYDSFDGGRKLRGTVYTEDGESYTGEIIWDDDESYTWEILDGEYRNIDFDIEFGLIKMIEKKNSSSSIITVRDGRSFRLKGTSDVDDDNKGIYIISSDGDEVEVDWDEFERVEFE